MFDDFYGNPAVQETLDQMIVQERIPQTMLFAGPEGIGKATLARRFAARLLGDAGKIEKDDQSLPGNRALVTEREKLPADKRVDDPLLFSSHPDFVTFPPDGPLRQISIQQMRILKDRAQFKPLKGNWRVFLIDHIDRANEQAANSLLKTLEEPPSHLIVIMTAENAYDLLTTIRSRSVMLQFGSLTEADMREFTRTRGLDHADRRIALASGSPGMAMSLDLESYDKRRTAMLALLEVASGRAPFAKWTKFSESLGASKSEKLEYYLKVLYLLLEDLILLQNGGTAKNFDVRPALESIAGNVSFEWIRKAVIRVDDLILLLRRNIQKSLALDSLVVELQENA